ncbi:hypothetical protein [Corynebacterium casei]|uniref:Secreted protein n=1 Tax=Corynebacterium casei LMG S-19264 TaxID=1285583 RepID=A0ABM5PQU7_9CORY|nr:hypothetical protein [Corynebacterium casei]AHI20368.1 hypothetical protein CCASEI_09025 [Corynebacterium casei LMG S-19264]
MSIVLTIIIVVALVALCAIIAAWVMTSFIGQGRVMDDLSVEEVHATMQGNRAFALNGEYDKVGCSAVKNGYSPQQVDDLLAVLTHELQKVKGEKEASKSNAIAETPNSVE